MSKEYKVNTDTFNLYADYPDPFLPDDSTAAGQTTVKTANSPAAAGPVAPESHPTDQIVAGMIQYNGMISNPKKKSRVAIITLHGKEYMVREHDKVEDVKILKIEKNRIEIVYKGEPFVISI